MYESIEIQDKQELEKAHAHPLWSEILEVVNLMREDILKSHKHNLSKIKNKQG